MVNQEPGTGVHVQVMRAATVGQRLAVVRGMTSVTQTQAARILCVPLEQILAMESDARSTCDPVDLPESAARALELYGATSTWVTSGVLPDLHTLRAHYAPDRHVDDDVLLILAILGEASQ